MRPSGFVTAWNVFATNVGIGLIDPSAGFVARAAVSCLITGSAELASPGERPH
jgi:hypothetical protein